MKRNKYNARKTVIDGITFDSQKEAKFYIALKQMEKEGIVRDIELQPKFWLKIGDVDVKIKSKGYPNGRRASYRADFKYFDMNHQKMIYVDVKGFDTEVSRLRRAIVEAIYGIEIEVV